MAQCWSIQSLAFPRSADASFRMRSDKTLPKVRQACLPTDARGRAGENESVLFLGALTHPLACVATTAALPNLTEMQSFPTNP